MLVLQRKKDQKIVIADGLITLTVTRIDRDKVAIGVDAPKDIAVHRHEIWQAIQRAAAEQQKQSA
jgi:carbon storage regulator